FRGGNGETGGRTRSVARDRSPCGVDRPARRWVRRSRQTARRPRKKGICRGSPFWPRGSAHRVCAQRFGACLPRLHEGEAILVLIWLPSPITDFLSIVFDAR